MSSTERAFEPEALFQAHLVQLIAWIKVVLKGRVQSVTPRPRQPYVGPARLPAANVKDDRVIVTYYEGCWLQPIDIRPAPGANVHDMVTELRQAFPGFQPRDPASEADEKPPPGPDSGGTRQPVTLAGLEDYFEGNPRVATYDREHNHLLQLQAGQPYRLEVSGDGRYLHCAVRVSDGAIQYRLDPKDVRAADLLEEIGAWLEGGSGDDPDPGEDAATPPRESAPPPCVEKPISLAVNNGAVLAAALAGLRESFRLLQGMGCTQALINPESTQLTFPDTVFRREE
ncbi:MAG: hypothetical protein WC497_03280 [Patescibacteria group bacterium]